MKPKLVIGLSCLMLFCLSSTSLADNPPNGFSSKIDLGVGWMNTKSLVEPGDDNKRLTSLNDTATSESELMAIPSFELDYHFGDGQMIYFGIPLQDEPRPTLGVRYEMPSGMEIDLSFYGMPEEVWQDPYLLGVDRIETDQTGYGAKIAFELADLELSYEIEKIRIDDDLIARRLPELAREGTIHKVGAAYEFEFDNGFELVPSFEYTMANIDGKCHEYKGYHAGFELRKMWENIGLNLSVEAGRNDYDAIHPIFSTTREDDTFETMAVLSWYDPLGYENFSFNVGGGYEKNDSNIDFYDSTGSFAFFTIGYRFGN